MTSSYGSFQAARDGQEQCVQRLLDFGADNEAKDKSGWTALMHVRLRFTGHSHFCTYSYTKHFIYLNNMFI